MLKKDSEEKKEEKLGAASCSQDGKELPDSAREWILYPCTVCTLKQLKIHSLTFILYQSNNLFIWKAFLRMIMYILMWAFKILLITQLV